MSWHPYNYLMDKGRRPSIACIMLEEAGDSANRLLLRLKNDVSILSLEGAQTTAFLAASDVALADDLTISDLCKLDDVLGGLQHETAEVSLMVGILILNNIEYRELCYQSVRHLGASHTTAPNTASSSTAAISNTDAQTEFDFQAGTVTVIGAFGVKHRYYVDLDKLRPKLQRPGTQLPSLPQTVLKVSHNKILLAALKAHLKSLMFSRTINGRDVRRAMGYEEDLYWMS